MSRTVLLIAVLLALVLASSAGAKPKPERPNGKRIHWVSYTYRTVMVATIDGHLVTVPLLCHVPAHARQWCEVAP